MCARGTPLGAGLRAPGAWRRVTTSELTESPSGRPHPDQGFRDTQGSPPGYLAPGPASEAKEEQDGDPVWACTALEAVSSSPCSQSPEAKGPQPETQETGAGRHAEASGAQHTPCRPGRGGPTRPSCPWTSPSWEVVGPVPAEQSGQLTPESLGSLWAASRCQRRTPLLSGDP